jgi:AraC-like DNA-binding protein
MPERAPPTAADVERAVAAVERAIGARLSFRDPGRLLATTVSAQRNYHDHPLCRHLIGISDVRCSTFEAKTALDEAHRRGHGFFKRCHGGVVEYVAPLLAGDAVVGTVMAGPWRFAGPDPAGTLTAPASALDDSSSRLLAALPESDRERLADAAALVDCLARWLSPLLDAPALADGDVNRRWQIEHLVGRRFMRGLTVDEVARELRLSPSRTRHLVRGLFGTTVAELVRRARIEHAKHLLARSELHIGEVATRCGFGDAGYFHRLFKRAVGVTPVDYRRSADPPPKA